MKTFLEAIGILTLFVVVFFSTEKTVSVVKDIDSLMIEIKQRQDEYKVDYVNALIKDDTIIPGISGKEVDINKSYIKLKEYGNFDSRLLVYKKTKPKETINKHYDKFVISGNKEKRMISLIFTVEENDNIEDILKILKSKNVKATFFFDGKWIEENIEKLKIIKNLHHTIGNLSYKQNYEDSSFVWVDTMIKRIGKQENSYCYSTTKLREVIDICKLYQDTTVIPNIIIKNNIYYTIKKELKSGALISIPVNSEIEELSNIIRFIKSKGYKLENLENHLKE